MIKRHGILVQGMVLLILLAQGLFDLAPVLALAVVPKPPLPSAALRQILEESSVQTAFTEEATGSEESHSCACENCGNGGMCCCAAAETPIEEMCFRAVCDSPQDMLRSGDPAPRILPARLHPVAVFVPVARPVLGSPELLLIGTFPCPAPPPPDFVS
ncbi:MAG: hypothetical protein OHK0029_29620 [Armatimonadaceae bacterium]